MSFCPFSVYSSFSENLFSLSHLTIVMMTMPDDDDDDDEDDDDNSDNEKL